MLKEDFSIYTNPDELGDIAVVGGSNMWGIFERQYMEIKEVEGYAPTFLVTDENAASITKNSTKLSIDLVDYMAISKHPDGTGMTLLILEKQ